MNIPITIYNTIEKNKKETNATLVQYSKQRAVLYIISHTKQSEKEKFQKVLISRT